ncbi:hypothetical protein DNU06_13970 [Putridiphycobacter roseus]|uniref:Uncharacterized protein n=1 Tax=Putridiphycobacter roseus TaxID=2219161 RepID=A0A2W1N010_9FLAO|nr:hypothetical protein [Putridiphycobacter roseus]PZE16231.1 hypothetical protein DNU06_13970 [Putridiphycobacter roseus]
MNILKVEKSIIQRKCSQCGEWNTNQSYCQFCNSPIDLKVIEKIETQKKDAIEAAIPKSKLEIWNERLKTHPFIPLRILYYLFYSVWIFFMGIGTLIAYFIAWAAG